MYNCLKCSFTFIDKSLRCVVLYSSNNDKFMFSANSVNSVTLLGNLGDDPDVKQIENGGLIVSFNIATNFSYFNKEGEKISVTDWHRVVLLGRLANLGAKYLVKGKQVYIQGRLCSRKYEAKDGTTKYITQVKADHMILPGVGKNGGNKDNANQKLEEDVKSADVKNVEDEPFNLENYFD